MLIFRYLIFYIILHYSTFMKIYNNEMYEDFFKQCIEVEKELYQNFDLCSICRRGYAISPELIYTKAILRPAKSFYYADANQILKAYRKYKLSSENKNSAISLRYKEIKNLFAKLKTELPNLSLIEIARLIEDMPAPRFYIGVSHAQHIFYKMYDSNRKSH